jgi:predicted NBD/HSP70 family sugar kinase
MRAGAPSQDEIRRQNLGALLRFVHARGQISRAELTTELGLNRSTIGALTADLTEAGLVTEEAPKETGRAGRPSLVVRAKSESIFAYAISIEADQVQVARVGLGGVLLDQRSVPFSPDSPITTLVGELPGTGRCVGAGVAVNSRRDGDALVARLSDYFEQVKVGTVAELCALAEHTRGVAVGCDNVIYVYGDVGVGAGIIAGGRPVTGHGGYGGEVGHMVVNPNGRRCSCGSKGCWETEIGERALLDLASSSGTAKEFGYEAVIAVIDRAARGDAVARTAVHEVGDWLGFGIANLVNIFNPELVIFGGTLRDIYLAAAAQVRSKLNSIGLPATREHVRLRTPTLGPEATLLGAAELAFQQLLSDPLA